MHLVSSSQEIILQAVFLLCSAMHPKLSFYPSETVSALKISSSMPWTLRWRKDLCRVYSNSLPPGAKVQGWIRWEYLDHAQIFHAGSLKRPEHDPERDQQGNGDPVSRAHSEANGSTTALPVPCNEGTIFQFWFHQLKHFCYLLSHLLVWWVAVAEQWWNLHVDTEERHWMRPKAHRASGPESGWSTWCPGVSFQQ